MLKYPIHDAFRRFIKELNHLYLNHSALFERDYAEGGFNWKDAEQRYPCCYAMQRYSSKESIVAVFNFAGSAQPEYHVHCDGKRLTVLMDTSADIYNGCRPNTAGNVIEGCNGEFVITLPPFTAMCFQVE